MIIIIILLSLIAYSVGIDSAAQLLNTTATGSSEPKLRPQRAIGAVTGAVIACIVSGVIGVSVEILNSHYADVKVPESSKFFHLM